MSKVSKALRSLSKKSPRPKSPLWAGPSGEGREGGITQSLLSRYLSCKERFRVKVIDGLAPPQQFSHRLEYGNMWHVCEEALATGNECRTCNGSGMPGGVSGYKCPGCEWDAALENYIKDLIAKYPLSQSEIQKWYCVCQVQFPVYVRHWADHPDVRNRTPLLQEQEFDVPHRLPSGRTVRLRGKWDSVDLIKDEDGNAGIWLQENKTKGDVDRQALTRQLTYDLQTMLYLVALQRVKEQVGPPLSKYVPDLSTPVLGIRYNVVRRPLSGGEGTIVRKKGSKNVPEESEDEFYARLRGVIDGTGRKQNGEPYQGPDHWFMRWQVRVLPSDVERFRRECLDPILENLCDDYEWWAWCYSHKEGFTEMPVDPFPGIFHSDRHQLFPHHWPRHYRHPFGVTNYVDEWGWADVDQYLANGDTAGLRRPETLFPELKGGL